MREIINDVNGGLRMKLRCDFCGRPLKAFANSVIKDGEDLPAVYENLPEDLHGLPFYDFCQDCAEAAFESDQYMEEVETLL